MSVKLFLTPLPPGRVNYSLLCPASVPSVYLYQMLLAPFQIYLALPLISATTALTISVKMLSIFMQIQLDSALPQFNLSLSHSNLHGFFI